MTEAEKALFKYFSEHQGQHRQQNFFEEETSLPRITEYLATPSAKQLIPRVIIGTARKTMEPLYVGSRLLKKINFKQSGDVIIFPSFGAMRANFVAEGEQYPRASVDWQKHTASEIKIQKSGIQIDVTEETLRYSLWDVIGLHVEEAGRALVRHKEQQCFRNFIRHGHTVLDNGLSDPNAHTTGCDEFGNNNSTMSTEDVLDLLIAVYNNGFFPTKVLLHTLAWTMFAKQNLLVGPLTQNPTRPDQPNSSFKIGPEAVAGRIPFAITAELSPFMQFDEVAKTYNMIAVDENNVGVLLEQEKLSQIDFNDPEKDIKSIKLREIYGIGITNEGRAIAVAKNLKLAPTYPKTPVQRILDVTPDTP